MLSRFFKKDVAAAVAVAVAAALAAAVAAAETLENKNFLLNSRFSFFIINC
jgi:hypothetical protein